MAKLTRKALTLFGGTGASSNFGQFGSQKAGAPVLTKDVETIQGLDAWLAGWQEAVELNEAPYLEDMNALLYVFGYELVYLMQEGVPEWNAATTYFEGSIVKDTDGSGDLYVSLIDDNLNESLPSRTNDANWRYVNTESDGVHIWLATVGYAVGDIVRKSGTAELYFSRTGGNINNALPAAPASNTDWEYMGTGLGAAEIPTAGQLPLVKAGSGKLDPTIIPAPQARAGRLVNSGDQINVVTATWTKMINTTEVFDIGGVADGANSKFVVPAGYAGIWHFHASSVVHVSGAGAIAAAAIYVNGAPVTNGDGGFSNGGTTDQLVQAEALCNLAEGDIVEGYIIQSTGGNRTFQKNILEGHFIGAA